VVVCHPHPLRGGDMQNNVVEALVTGFADAGFATLRFNFRGVGASTGTHDDGRGEIDDVQAAVTGLLARHAVETVVVAGYSFGAWVGLAAGARDARVHRLIGVAPPVASRDHGFLAGTGKPTLLIAGEADPIAPLDRLRTLDAGMAGSRALVVVGGADHFFVGREAEVAAAGIRFLSGAWSWPSLAFHRLDALELLVRRFLTLDIPVRAAVLQAEPHLELVDLFDVAGLRCRSARRIGLRLAVGDVSELDVAGPAGMPQRARLEARIVGRAADAVGAGCSVSWRCGGRTEGK
jgi:hypothetical protein